MQFWYRTPFPLTRLWTLIAVVAVLMALAPASQAKVVTAWQVPQELQSIPNMAWPSWDVTPTPQVVVSENGTRASAIWMAPAGGNSAIYSSAATLANGTTTWTLPSMLSLPGQNAAFPRIAISRDGSVAVATWLRFDGTAWVVQASSATLQDGSMVWGPPANVASTNLKSRSWVQAGATSPQVGLSSDGSIAIAVWANFNNDSKEYAMSSASGLVQGPAIQWGSETPLMSGTTGFDLPRYNTEGMPNPKVTLSSDGRFAVAVWRQVINDVARMASATARIDGLGMQWGSMSLLSTPENSVFRPSLAASPDGRKVVALWQQEAPEPRSSWTPTTQAVWLSAGTTTGSNTAWTQAQVLKSQYGESGDFQAAISTDGSRVLLAWLGTNGMSGIAPTTNSAVVSMVGDLTSSGLENGQEQILSDLSDQAGTMAGAPNIYFSDNDRSAIAIWTQKLNASGASLSLRISQRSLVEQSAWTPPQPFDDPVSAYVATGSALGAKRIVAVWLSVDDRNPIVVRATASDEVEEVQRTLSLSARLDPSSQPVLSGRSTGLKDGTQIAILVSHFNARMKKWSPFKKTAQVTLAQGTFNATLAPLKTSIQVKAVAPDGTESSVVTLTKKVRK